MKNTFKYGSPLILLFLFIFLASFASPGKNSDKTDHSKQKSEEQAENLDPGEIIIDHVVDHYSWHIVTIGEKHISIPLPVILYSKDRGFFCFMSNKFHHGHESYKKFKIAEVGPNKGSIVELTSGGEVKGELPLDFSLTKTAAGIMVSILLMIIVFISIANSYKRRRKKPI